MLQEPHHLLALYVDETKKISEESAGALKATVNTAMVLNTEIQISGFQLYAFRYKKRDTEWKYSRE